MPIIPGRDPENRPAMVTRFIHDKGERTLP
jgi:hypothetical protein